MKTVHLGTAILIGLMAGGNRAIAQSVGATPTAATQPAQAAAPATRPVPPTRDPNTPGYVSAKELPDGAVPPPDADGNFIIGPTHTSAFEMVVHEGVPRGTVHT